MGVPFSSSTFSVRIPARSWSESAVPPLSFRTTSAKVSVMFVPASFVFRPFGGLNTGDGGVMSPVALMLTRI